MKNKLLDFVGYCLFILWFIILIPFLMIVGMIKTPIRYYKHINDKVLDRKPMKYWW